MSEDKYDVIIIGGGVAGLTAAYRLAQAGVEVVVVERGDYCGSKNLSGGVLYSRILHQLMPDFEQEAPFERMITHYLTSVMTEDHYFNLEYGNSSLGGSPYNAVSVLRSKFDRWLAEKAEEAGAMLVTGIKADKVLKEGERIVGIRTGEEEMLADVVIAADGINSFIAREAGVRGEIKQGHLAVGVKALIEVPAAQIEERFHLQGREGAAYAMLGAASRGLAGGGFLYTNLDSISIGTVIHIQDLVRQKVSPGNVLDDLLEHPLVAPLVKDGKMMEYGAHLIGEGGLQMIPTRLYHDGLLIIGDAAGFDINSGLVVRGMDLAIGSALAAADTVIEAKAKGNFSSAALSAYAQKLTESFVLQDLRLYSKTPEFMENRRLYRQYPAMVDSLFTKIYNHDFAPKEHLSQVAKQALKASGVSLFDLIKDGVKGVRWL